ncbi:MAG: response regulator [Acidobacteriia bacterium]|nr:response regulator [Terriglobia bacterium]
MPEIVPKRVVVVEDEESLCRLLGGYLTRAGYAVTTYTSAQPLLEKMQSSGVVWDVAVIDLTLPDVSGEHVAVRLLEAAPDIRVVLTSGLPWSTLSMLHGRERVTFLQKPFRPSQLLDLIR